MNNVRRQGATVASSVQKNFRSVGRSMQRLGSTLTKSLTLPLAAFGGASVKAFADFDSAMTQSTAIMSGVTDEVRKEMEAAARSVSQQLTTTSTEAAESYFFLASAGLDAKQSIAALPQVAKFAQAGMFDMAKATDLATDAQSALGLTVDDAADNLENMARVTDVLVKANTLANASVQQFSEALTNRAAAAMRAANKEIEEGVAVLAAFADQGMKGQMAGEQFARILRILSQEAAKNRKLFTDLGIIDTAGNLNNMADIIEVLTREMEGLSDAEKSAKLEQLGFTARVQAAIKPLLGTADAIRGYEEGLRNARGITDEVANKQLKSLTSQFKILRNTVVNAGQAIGASIAETFDIKGLVKSFQESIKTGIDWFNSLSQETRSVAFKIAALLGASGPVIGALGVLSAALGAISAPIAGAAAAVAAGAALLINNWSEVESYFTTGGGAQMWEDLKGIVKEAKESIESLWNEFGDEIMSVVKFSFGVVLEVVERTLDGIHKLMQKFNGNFDDELDVWEDHWFTTLSKIDSIITGSVMWTLMKGGQLALQGWELLIDPWERTFEWFQGEVDGVRQSLANLANVPSMDFGFSAEDLVTGQKNVKDATDEATEALTKYGSVFHEVNQKAGIATAAVSQGMSVVKESIRAAKVEGMELDEVMAKGLWKAKEAMVNMGQALQSTVTNAITNFATTLGNVFTGDAGASGFFNNLLLIVSDFANQFGKMLVGAGIAALAFKELLANPVAAIVAGTALIAASTAVRNLLKDGPGEFHQGGIVPGSGEKLAMVQGGEGIFTPDQMAAMGNMQATNTRSQRIHITGEFIQRGTDLKAVIDEVTYRQQK